MSAAAGQLVSQPSTLFTVGNPLGAGTLLAFLSMAGLRAAYGQELPKTITEVSVSRYEVCVLPGMANYWAPDVTSVKRTRLMRSPGRVVAGRAALLVR